VRLAYPRQRRTTATTAIRRPVIAPTTLYLELAIVIATNALQNSGLFEGYAWLFSNGVARWYVRLRRRFDTTFAAIFAGASVKVLGSRLSTQRARPRVRVESPIHGRQPRSDVRKLAIGQRQLLARPGSTGKVVHSSSTDSV